MIIDRINAAICAAIKNNLDPTEIWLGPREVREIEEQLNQAYLNNNRTPIVLSSYSDGFARWGGKVLRFMKKDGVRVGVSYGDSTENG